MNDVGFSLCIDQCLSINCLNHFQTTLEEHELRKHTHTHIAMDVRIGCAAFSDNWDPLRIPRADGASGKGKSKNQRAFRNVPYPRAAMSSQPFTIMSLHDHSLLRLDPTLLSARQQHFPNDAIASGSRQYKSMTGRR